MQLLILMILHVALHCVTSQEEIEIETLMDKVLVLRVPHDSSTSYYDVTLICGEAYHDQPVFWRKASSNMAASPVLQGNQVKVRVEEMAAGNYTCHLGPDGPYLNHTLILVQMNPDNKTVILEEIPGTEKHIHCSAHNYNGSFHCTWKRHERRSSAAVLLLEAERGSEEVSCELDADGTGMHCEDPRCPFAEEQNRIILTVYIRNSFLLEAYTSTFYLREIVRPQKVSNLSYSEGDVFSWDYPTTWDKPCTYYSLLFQVMVVGYKEPCHSPDSRRIVTPYTTEATNFKVEVKNKKYTFCVQAQDMFTTGHWSAWSHYEVKKS